MATLALPAAAEDGRYRLPPPAIETVLVAQPLPQTFVSPGRDVVLLATPLRLPPVAELAAPLLRLAGLRIDPQTNGIHEAPCYTAFDIVRISDGRVTKIVLPPGAHASAPVFSADGQHFVFANATAAGTELWIGATETGSIGKVPSVALNSIFGDALHWMPDGKTLLLHVVAPGRGAPPPLAVAAGPTIEETGHVAAAAVTFEDLLTDAHDADLFAYYATGQYELYDIYERHAVALGPPGIYARSTVSPDGRFVAFDRVHQPYSYNVPWTGFPHQTSVVDLTGRVVRAFADVPLQERATFDDTPGGARDITWIPGRPATLAWVEMRGTHDAAFTVDAADQSAPHPLVTLGGRFEGFDFVANSSLVFVRDHDRAARATRTLELDLQNGSATAVATLRDGDRYADPGRPLDVVASNGDLVAARDGDAIFLTGDGYSNEGRRPFVDRMDLHTHVKQRIFQSAAVPLETPLAVLDDRGTTFLVQRQSPVEPPDLFVRRLGDAHDARQLTHFPDPTPSLRTLQHRIVAYKRADGIDLTFSLWLPPNYREGTRLPTLLWAYPFEYSDPAVASQRTNFAQTFEEPSGSVPLLAALAGYAVLDNAAMPVVGDAKTVNDTFIEQITSDAKAAIDRAVALGVTDPARVAVGGHSYGAFMTANLLAHTSLFRAGIARSGAYNRSLTPFGFQDERRTYWEATETYTKLSPFTFADRIKAPLLLIHGMADDNTGTFPLQSERMYAALRGTGGTARLVMLPYEAHHYVARESVETTMAEMIDWLDRFVRGGPSRNG